MILGIDPGNEQSAFALLDWDLKPKKFGIVPNNKMLSVIDGITYKRPYPAVAIEMIASYGMAVGATVFDTCVWTGRFIQEAYPAKVELIYRKDEKMVLCGSMKAKDGNIRQALIDRFAKHDFKNGKGTKSNPDWFHGVSKDVWAAIAVGVTYHDLYIVGGQCPDGN